MWIIDTVASHTADQANARDNAWIVSEFRASARKSRRARARRFAARARAAIWGAVGEWIAGATVGSFLRRRFRAELEGLSDRMLADIGIARADIASVARAAYRRQQGGAAARASDGPVDGLTAGATHAQQAEEEAAPAKAA